VITGSVGITTHARSNTHFTTDKHVSLRGHVNGSAQCRGKNDYGQIGEGAMTASTVPVQVQGSRSGATAGSVSKQNACAIAKSTTNKELIDSFSDS
jgi:hypothetical protein